MLRRIFGGSARRQSRVNRRFHPCTAESGRLNVLESRATTSTTFTLLNTSPFLSGHQEAELSGAINGWDIGMGPDPAPAGVDVSGSLSSPGDGTLAISNGVAWTPLVTDTEDGGSGGGGITTVADVEAAEQGSAPISTAQK
jgi:hypothetical protein